MSGYDNDSERFKRIRDRQIHLRDPQKPQQDLQHKIAKRRKRGVRTFSLIEILTDVPTKFTASVLGLVVGLLILLFLPEFVEAEWVGLAGIAATVFLTILGFFVGRALDAKEELEELVGK